ncbi:SulA-like leucine-rich domain-containing protein [Pseudoalteromonas luteoviolacea]|uniref:Cell division inhibitor n=1 Tax=Pseudoalteromonas luteoviolacea DSM 6061 TaxID=1365250 RepID=A0A166W9E3_9GAMM|nr:SulA-like leucine-rich domain-containing protein [Pseudoalteromonas luteoviolacea]KZN36252.1 hypothetical protein N475_17805 [Pseudoalteromonas luteoviolacea DSM 6061]KZN55601.1 hypothetical protein N474_14865 [Pseudoalteromonas luteoviolacea CPMOR-2]MBE0386697.1 hypothetical protein [Pseudoalteromonas luteoviolacea DSM 6061]TQF71540.1 hypothetical protein FLM44_10790 [Pseudoalteromonas luteoviolacea]
MLHTSTILSTRSGSQHSNASFNIVNTRDESTTSLELMKILGFCNSKAGWTLLIAPDHTIRKSMLDHCDIDINKLLVLKLKDLIDLEHTLDCALNNGNFAAVITWPGILSAQQIQQRSLSHSDTTLFCFKEACSMPASEFAH